MAHPRLLHIAVPHVRTDCTIPHALVKPRSLPNSGPVCETKAHRPATHNSRGCGSRLTGTGISMNTLILPTAALCLATCTPLLAAAPLPAERLSVAPLPPNNPHRVYVVDDAFEKENPARVHLFDGDTYQRLGQIDAGFNPAFNLSPDAKTSIVGTTYFSRGSRGVRTDVVEFTDNSNLKVTHEIVLPSKRAMTLPTIFSLPYRG